MTEKIKVNGFYIGQYPSMDALVGEVSVKKGLYIALNFEKLVTGDEYLRNLSERHVTYSDGEGAVWASSYHGGSAIKLAGVDFWLELLKKYEGSKTFYFIGGTESVICRTVSKACAQFPSANILGHRNGFMNETEMIQLRDDVVNLKPDIIFVAMGSPKQEMLMNNFNQHHEAVYVGLGGSFDVFVGEVKRAPPLFILFRCEWLYRVLKDYRRVPRLLKMVRNAKNLFC